MAVDDELAGPSSRAKAWWRRVRNWVGYSAFAAALAYGIINAPDAVWTVEPGWLILAVLVLGLSIFFQVAQVVIFLRAHGVPGGWFTASLFTLRKGVLNVLLPARSGTLLVLQTLTGRYPVKWYQYIYFSLVASIASVGVSVAAAAFVWLGWQTGIALSAAGVLAALLGARFVRLHYVDRMGWLLLVAAAMYSSFLAGFWCLINGLGWKLDAAQAATFAILLNLLALVSITPGNLGVRETLIGAVSPLLSLPVPVGILVGACFYVLRLLVSAVLLAIFEWMEARRTALVSNRE